MQLSAGPHLFSGAPKAGDDDIESCKWRRFKMRIRLVFTVIAFMVLCAGSAAAQEKKPDWSLNATIIEACSCPMFCQCYFNAKPASQEGHEGHGSTAGHFCLFNNAFKVNKGTYGNVKLDGAKFWVSGDLGGDFSMGQMDWAVVTF